MRIIIFLLINLVTSSAWGQQLIGIPASDTLGAEDLMGNPSFIGGVANGGSTAHGVW